MPGLQEKLTEYMRNMPKGTRMTFDEIATAIKHPGAGSKVASLLRRGGSKGIKIVGTQVVRQSHATEIREQIYGKGSDADAEHTGPSNHPEEKEAGFKFVNGRISRAD